MYESSGPQFFKTATGIQSRPDTFYEPRFIMTFLTSLGVTEIPCSFRLVLKVKTSKKIPKSSKLELCGGEPGFETRHVSEGKSFLKF